MTYIQIDRAYSSRELGHVLNMAQTHICRLCRNGSLRGAHKDERGQWVIPGIAVTNWLRAHMPCAQAPSTWMTPDEMARYIDMGAEAIRVRCREGKVPDLPDGTPGFRLTHLGGLSVWQVHGDALRGIVSFTGPQKRRPKVRPKEDQP